MLPFIASWGNSPIGNKVSDREFYWCADHEFYSRLGISNCKSIKFANKFVKKFMLLRKNESSLENKTISLEDFSSELKFSKKKKSLQDEGSDTKFSYQMLLWISCNITQIFTNVNFGGSYSLTNKSNLIVALCKDWRYKSEIEKNSWIERTFY